MSNQTPEILNKFYALLLVVFFIHGVGYFFYGEIYDKSNPIKLVKYITMSMLVFFAFIHWLLNRNKIKFSNFIILFVVAASSAVFVLFYIVVGVNVELIFYFILPVFSLYIPALIKYEQFLRVLVVTLFLAFIVSVAEYFLFSGISSRFNVTGFRSISIFVNPNALGAMAVLMSTLILASNYSIFMKGICISLAIILVVLSGSKTALLAIALFVLGKVLYRFLFVRYKVVDIAFFTLLSLFSITILSAAFESSGSLGLENLSFESRGFSLGSGLARLEQHGRLIDALSGCPVFPLACAEDLYVDHGLMISWLYLGLFGFLFFSLSVIFAIAKSFHTPYSPFFILFFVMLQTTNLLNIWPTAYLFWMVLGYTRLLYQDK